MFLKLFLAIKPYNAMVLMNQTWMSIVARTVLETKLRVSDLQSECCKFYLLETPLHMIFFGQEAETLNIMYNLLVHPTRHSKYCQPFLDPYFQIISLKTVNCHKLLNPQSFLSLIPTVRAQPEYQLSSDIHSHSHSQAASQ